MDFTSPDVIESHTTQWDDFKRTQCAVYLERQRIDYEPLFQYGDRLVVENGEKVSVTALKPHVKLEVRKKPGNLASLEQQPVNATYALEDDVFRRRIEGRVDVEELFEKLENKDLSADFMPTASNKDLIAKQENQKFTMNEIEAMKESNMTSLDILKRLCESSSTWEGKTEFSQMKWLKKKFAKYSMDVHTRSPTPANLLTVTGDRSDPIMNYIRNDTIAMILAMTNTGAGSRHIVIENGTDGLFTGAVQRRLGDSGATLCLHTNRFAQRYLEDLNLSKAERRRVIPMAYDALASYGWADQNAAWNEHQQKQIELHRASLPTSATSLTLPCITPAAQHFLQHKATAVIILHSTADPLSLLLPVLPFVLPSSPIVLWATSIEPLAQAMTYLEKNGLATNCRILDYFYRPLQVLPNRTHPHMSMEASGGYMLHGYTVDYFIQEPIEVVETQDADAPKKPQVKSLLHPLYRNTNDAFQYEPLLSASQDNENSNDNHNNNNNKRKNPPQ